MLHHFRCTHKKHLLHRERCSQCLAHHKVKARPCLPSCLLCHFCCTHFHSLHYERCSQCHHTARWKKKKRRKKDLVAVRQAAMEAAATQKVGLTFTHSISFIHLSILFHLPVIFHHSFRIPCHARCSQRRHTTGTTGRKARPCGSAPGGHGGGSDTEGGINLFFLQHILNIGRGSVFL